MGRSLDQDVYDEIELALLCLRKEKPNDRSGRDRRYAITITEMEKVLAYFKTYILDKDE